MKSICTGLPKPFVRQTCGRIVAVRLNSNSGSTFKPILAPLFGRLALCMALAFAGSLQGFSQSLPTRLWIGTGHLSSVKSVAISSDSTLMASGSQDLTIKLWRMSDGALLRTLVGHTAEVNSVAFSPDGTLVASASSDRTVRIWRVSDGALLRVMSGHTDVIRAVAFSPDGTMVASGSQDRSVILWRVSDGVALRTLTGNTSWVMTVAFSPDGVSVASGGADLTVTQWRVADGATLRRFTAHADWVMSIAFSPDSSTILSGGMDFSVKFWRASDGALLRTIGGFGDAVNCVAYSRDGASVAVSDWTRKVSVFRVSDGVNLMNFVETALVNSVKFTADGTKLGYGRSDAMVVLASNSSSGGTVTKPSLDVLVSTDKPAYANREKATLLVSVTDGALAVSGCAVSVTVTSSKGTRTTYTGTTASNGLVSFGYTVNSTKQGTGTYTLDASASKTGYNSASDSTTFQVLK